MKPPHVYVKKVEETLELADTPPNNRFYMLQEAAAWAQIALLSLQAGPNFWQEDVVDADADSIS